MRHNRPIVVIVEEQINSGDQGDYPLRPLMATKVGRMAFLSYLWYRVTSLFERIKHRRVKYPEIVKTLNIELTRKAYAELIGSDINAVSGGDSYFIELAPKPDCPELSAEYTV